MVLVVQEKHVDKSHGALTLHYEDINPDDTQTESESDPHIPDPAKTDDELFYETERTRVPQEEEYVPSNQDNSVLDKVNIPHSRVELKEEPDFQKPQSGKEPHLLDHAQTEIEVLRGGKSVNLDQEAENTPSHEDNSILHTFHVPDSGFKTEKHPHFQNTPNRKVEVAHQEEEDKTPELSPVLWLFRKDMTLTQVIVGKFIKYHQPQGSDENVRNFSGTGTLTRN